MKTNKTSIGEKPEIKKMATIIQQNQPTGFNKTFETNFLREYGAIFIFYQMKSSMSQATHTEMITLHTRFHMAFEGKL